MQRKKRSTSFILTTLCTFALLLAAAGTSAFSFGQLPEGQNLIRNAAPHVAVTPGMLQTVIPGVIPTGTPGMTSTVTPGATMTGTPGAATMAQGVYIGEVPTNHAWVALDSNGSQVMAFVTDGSRDHPVTFAQWFKGPLQDNKVTAVASKPEEGRVDATLTQSTATGIVMLPNGISFPFTADVLPPARRALNAEAGLYRSEQIINGQNYVGGWVLAPNTVPAPSATATATETPALVPTGTPSMILSPTATPSISGLIQGGGLYNKQTDKVQPVPELTIQDITAKKITVPNLGDFKLIPCQQNLC